jgi:hypothetical protein
MQAAKLDGPSIMQQSKKTMTEIQYQRELNRHLSLIESMCGNPDPQTGLRLILAEVRLIREMFL